MKLDYDAAENGAMIDAIGDNHVGTAVNTPLRDDAFELSDDEKVVAIEEKFRDIMNVLGLDLTDDSLSGTPQRVAKMYVKEIFKGLNPANKPAVTVFDNKYKYNEMLVEKNISFKSNCEHHFVPIIGKAHVAYISTGKVVGLSKINRLVDYYARRPQVQERLTMQIAHELEQSLDTPHIAVVIEATHMCVTTRGIQDATSTTVTSAFLGDFKQKSETKNEFLRYISHDLMSTV